MTKNKKILWVGALILVLCGCEKRQTPIVHGKPVGAVKRTVEKFSRGGEGWGWVQYPEIKREVLAITNAAERAQAVLASAELIASMNLLGLSQRERISVASKYWALTSQFYDLLVMDEISDDQRVKYLLFFLNTFRALCFSLPLCAQLGNETVSDFQERRLWAKDLYAEYYNFASRWHRVYRPDILKTIPSVSERDFDKMTRFVCDFPSREVFLKNPVFTEELRSNGSGRVVKSPVIYGRHTSELSGITDSCQLGVQTNRAKPK